MDDSLMNPNELGFNTDTHMHATSMETYLGYKRNPNLHKINPRTEDRSRSHFLSQTHVHNT